MLLSGDTLPTDAYQHVTILADIARINAKVVGCELLATGFPVQSGTSLQKETSQLSTAEYNTMKRDKVKLVFVGKASIMQCEQGTTCEHAATVSICASKSCACVWGLVVCVRVCVCVCVCVCVHVHLHVTVMQLLTHVVCSAGTAN